MRLVVLANEQLKEELLSTGINDSCKVDWINSSKEFSSYTDGWLVHDDHIKRAGTHLPVVAREEKARFASLSTLHEFYIVVE